jgi:hypothetical protein
LDSTRAYAVEKLGDGPGANSVRRLHTEYIRDKTLSLAPKNGFVVKSHQESHSKMVDELRSAIAWAFSAKGDPELGIEVIASSAYLWFQLSLFEEFKVHADRALEAMSGTPNVSKAELRLLLARGPALYETLGAVPELFSTATRALQLAKQLDDRLAISGALHNLWRYHHGLGEYSQSLDVALQIEEYVSGDSQHCRPDVRTLLSCKFSHNEFSDLAKTWFRFLQLICGIKCKNLRLVPALIASR